MDVKLEALLEKMQEYHKTNGSYIPLQSNKIRLSEQELSFIQNNQQLFFMASRSRVLLNVWICKVIRDTFELYGYSDLELPNELYNAIRNKFKTKAFNRNKFIEIYSVEKSNYLTYEDFVDIEQKFINEYNACVSTNKLSTFTHIRIKPKSEKISYLKELENILSVKRNADIIALRAEGKTLDEIGESLSVTRERTRQIELKPKLGIERWLITRESELAEKFTKNGLVNESKIKKDLGEKYWNIIKYVISTSRNEGLIWRYCELLNIFYINKKTIESVSFPENKTPEEITQFMKSEGFDFWNDSYSLMYIDKKGIESNAETNSKLTIGKAINIIAQKYYPDGIKLTDEKVMQSFADKINNTFNMKVSIGRAFYTRVQDILVMCNKSTYIASSYINIDEKTIKEIEDFINGMTEKQIPYEVLFNHFEKSLQENNIHNYYALHGILKYLSENKNMDIKCHRYYITKKEHKDFKSKEFFKEFADYLMKANKPVSIEQLEKDFPTWNPLYFRYAIMYYPEIAQWTKTEYINIRILHISKEDEEILLNTVKANLSNRLGYTNSYVIFKKLKTDNPDILVRIHTDNEGKLYHVLQYVCRNDFYCRRPHILKEWNSLHFSTQDLIHLAVKDKTNINKKELMEELESVYGEKNSSISLAIQKELENYIKIDSFNYVPDNTLTLTDSEKEQIKSVLKNYLISDEVILPNRITDFSKMPKLKFEWNPWLLCAIINKYGLGYKLIGKKNLPSQNILIVIIRENSDLKDKKSVFAWLLENDFNKEKTQANIFQYAKTTGIFHTNLTSDDIKDFC